MALEEAEDSTEEGWNDAVFKSVNAKLWCFVGAGHVARAFFRAVLNECLEGDYVFDVGVLQKITPRAKDRDNER